MTSVKTTNNELVAKRWAKALMELALEDNWISKEDILDDLKEVSENINSSEELSNVINNPSISTEEKQTVLSKLFQNRVLPIVYNFLFALNLKKRIQIIESIAIEFGKELERVNNIVKINVTSAIEINEEKKNSIKNRIAEKLQKEIIVEWGVDADIIAGLIFNINETVIDNSVRNKLEDIEMKMIRG